MAAERKPRKLMPVPGLSDRDRASIATTAKANGLGKAEAEEPPQPTPTPKEPSAVKPVESQPKADTSKAAPVDKPQPSVAKLQKQTGAQEQKQLRVSVAPSSDLAGALHEKIERLSPDAKKFVTTAALLREFVMEHDAELAQLFRKTHGL